MLIDSLKNAYREFTGQVHTLQPVVTVPARLPAANQDSFSRAEMQARRLRRKSRQSRAVQHGINGWSVRAW